MIGQQRIVGDRGKDRRVGVKPRRPGHHGRQVEAKSVDPGAGHEMAQRVERQVAHRRVSKIERVAGTGIVDQRAVGRTRVTTIVQPAQRQGRSLNVALSGVIEHKVQDRPDPIGAQNRDRAAQLRHPAGA